MKILIIEDEYALADAVAEILKNEKFDVNIITNGQAGEDEALTGIYDLIILDVMLPGKDGADDYVTKPFHTRELLARVKVILKRNNNLEDINILGYGDLELNLDTCKLTCGENSIVINGKELELLQLLIINKNIVVSREMLANKIWGYESDAEYNNVEVYISFIRKKLKLLKSKVIIKAVRGIGYKLEEKND